MGAHGTGTTMKNMFNPIIFTRRRIIAIAIGIVGAAVIYSTINFGVARYFGNSEKPRATAPTDAGAARRYDAIYRTLPAGFTHCGRMLFYTAPADTSVRAVADLAVPFTSFYKAYRLRDAIRSFNAISGDEIEKGQMVFIPHSLPALMPDMRNSRKPPLIFARGLYYTGSSAGRESLLENIDEYKELGINCIVFDAKDVCGIVNYKSRVPEAIETDAHGKRTIDDIDQLIRILKEKKIYVIARLALFHDQHMFKHNPDWAIQSKSGDGPWRAEAKEKWLDPTNKAAQDYNLALAVELAEKGVDEIQFDYIRFPTTGKQGDAEFAYDFGTMSRDDTITAFLKRAHEEIAKRNVLLSIDIFGVVAWGKEIDIIKTGQRIERLAEHCDIISPMLYPSHFNDDFDGYARPGDHPYYFIHEGCKKVIALAKGKTVRPWLQAFRWRVSNYNEHYIIKQVKAVKDSGAYGYLFWNAANDYRVVLRAMESIDTETALAGERSASPLAAREVRNEHHERPR